MKKYLHSHPYYHDITESEAKLLINPQETFLFCENNLIYGAYYNNNWQIRTRPIKSMDEITITLGDKFSNLTTMIEGHKKWLSGFATFEILPVINKNNSSYDINNDFIIEENYQKRLSLCSNIYNKLQPFVPKSEAEEGTDIFEKDQIKIHKLKCYSGLQFICSVEYEQYSMYLFISKNELRVCGGSRDKLFINDNMLFHMNELLTNY